MTPDVFVVDASAHSYNLREDNYAAGRYSQAVVDAFHGAHYGLSPVGNVVVALRMTSPLCHALPYFQMEIERVLAAIPGIEDIECTFDHGGNWQPDHMTVGAHLKLAERRDLIKSHAVKSTKTPA